MSFLLEALKEFVTYEAAHIRDDETERIAAWVFFGFALFFVVAIVVFWRENILLGILAVIFSTPLIVLLLLSWLILFLAPHVRAWQLRKTRLWLDGALRERRAQEAEAEQIMKVWRTQPPEIHTILRAGLWWQVLAFDLRGQRLLVQPVFDDRLRVLVGEDLHLKRPFFMAVPPDVWSIEEALDWLWRLSSGFVRYKDQVYEV